MMWNKEGILVRAVALVAVCLAVPVLGADPSPPPALSPVSSPLPAPAEPGFTPSGLPDFTRQQSLSLARAQEIALDNNLELANARRDVRLAELELVRIKAAYDPYVKADASYSTSEKPSSQAVFGTQTETTSFNLSSGITTITGGSLSLSFNNSRQETNSLFSTLNPSYNTDLSLNINQPLLKNRYDNLRALEIETKENDLMRSRLTFDSKTLEIEAQVEDAYWSLVKARLDLELKRQALALAERMDHMTRSQVQAGTAARVSTLQTEANLASARAALVRSENEYRKAQFGLKVVMNLEADDLWYLEILPSDLPVYQPPDFSRDQVIQEALANNFSLRQSRLNLANAEISTTQAKNRTLPQLDLRASISLAGLAGTDNPRDQIVETGFVIPNPLPPDQFPQPYMLERTVVAGQPSEYAGGYNDAVKNMLDADNLSWSAGLTFNLPLGNRAGQADYERTLINYEKLLADLHNQERQVFMNLINLLSDLEASHRSFLAAREAARLQAQNLATEEKKFSLGLNTSYEVLQAEESWAEARSSEIGALVEYIKNLGRIERARHGYLPGGAASLPVSLPSSLSLPSGGISAPGDMSQLQHLMSQLPPGVDINMLKSMMP